MINVLPLVLNQVLHNNNKWNRLRTVKDRQPDIKVTYMKRQLSFSVPHLSKVSFNAWQHLWPKWWGNEV